MSEEKKVFGFEGAEKYDAWFDMLQATVSQEITDAFKELKDAISGGKTIMPVNYKEYRELTSEGKSQLTSEEKSRVALPSTALLMAKRRRRVLGRVVNELSVEGEEALVADAAIPEVLEGTYKQLGQVEQYLDTKEIGPHTTRIRAERGAAIIRGEESPGPARSF